MRITLLTLLFGATANIAAAAQPGTATLDAPMLARLAQAAKGERIEIAAFPSAAGTVAAMTFQRIDVYADDARIVVVDATGQHEIARSARIQLIGETADGASRVGLSFDAHLASAPSGAGSGPDGSFALTATRAADGWQLAAIPAADALPPGVALDYVANDDAIPNPFAKPEPLLTHLGGDQTQGTVTAQGIVAIDTDTTFLAERFSGNTTQATAWIADLFTQMNVFYERDLGVQLRQGTTFLRVASDPFANADTSATLAMLNEFGTYWQANYSTGGNTVPRAFAALLSGNASSPNSGSGIAWVNSYCRTPSNGGSYSVNQVFTFAGSTPAQSAFLVGHEIGHNFGASHTHCTNLTNGNYPTPTSTIDTCYSGEGGCFSGTTVCPSGTPDAPRGTLMSYCHIKGCGDNVLKFAPIQITRLRALIASQSTCLAIDVLFRTGFE